MDQIKLYHSPFTLCFILSSILFIGALTGCIEQFNYHPESNGSSILVVDGGITNLQEKQYLHIARTSVYGSLTTTLENGAQVWILENGKVIDTCFQSPDGTYQIDGDMIKAQPGKQYAIRIRTANGRTYESDPEIMPYPVKPDTAYTEMENVKLPNSAGDPVIDSWQIDLYINTPVQSAKSYAFLRWRVLEAYNFMEYNNNTPLAHPKTCYMTNDINYQDIQLYNGQELKGGELEHHLILTRLAEPDVQFYLAHYYNISQYSITREAYDYWSKLKSVSNPSGSFLDTPPAAVIGNVHNITNKDEVVLGNFEVAAVNIIRVKGRPADLLPHYVHYPCSDIPRPTYCYDCLTLPNSSLVEPSYW